MHANRLPVAAGTIAAVAIAAIAGMGLLAAGVGAQTPAPIEPAPTVPTTPTSPPVPVTKKVAVKDDFYKPKKLRVAVGDKVIWKWEGFALHDVTVAKGPQKFASKHQSSGTFSRTIKKPGTYKIVCTIHPGMAMTLQAT